jgi:exopolysaccharide production protein ExoZ
LSRTAKSNLDGTASSASALSRRFEDWFEISRTEAVRFLPMEGLRGLAVSLVFFVHYTALVEPWISRSAAMRVADGLGRLGNIGVDLFFVLSGYLIYGSLIRRRQSLVRFFERRLQRLYPAFIVTLAVYVLLSVIAPGASKLPAGTGPALRYILENALLLPGIFPIPPLIKVAWSLSYEVFYYLAVPFLIGVLGLRRWRGPWRAALFFVAAVVWQAIPLPYPRMSMFLGGMIVAELLPLGVAFAHRRALLDGLTASLIALTVVLWWSDAADAVKFGVLWPTWVLLCFTALSLRGAIATSLSWTPLRWLGNMSYSYYLTHGLALQVFFLVLRKFHAPSGGEADLFWALLPPAFAATLALSMALYILIERPYSIVSSVSAKIAPPLPKNVADAGSTN